MFSMRKKSFGEGISLICVVVSNAGSADGAALMKPRDRSVDVDWRRCRWSGNPKQGMCRWTRVPYTDRDIRETWPYIWGREPFSIRIIPYFSPGRAGSGRSRTASDDTAVVVYGRVFSRIRVVCGPARRILKLGPIQHSYEYEYGIFTTSYCTSSRAALMGRCLRACAMPCQRRGK